jgi:hypothetical protein
MIDLSAAPAALPRAYSASRGYAYSLLLPPPAALAAAPASAPTPVPFHIAVFTADGARLLAFAPPPPAPLADFRRARAKCLSADGDCIVTEFAPGITISLFFNDAAEQWEVATALAVGGDGGYTYPPPPGATFRATLAAALGGAGGDLGAAPRIATLNRAWCFNLVLAPPPAVRATLTSVFAIDRDRRTATRVRAREYAGCGLPTPRAFVGCTYDTVVTQHTPADIAGAVVTDESAPGVAGYIKNPAYVDPAQAAASAELRYFYLCLARIGKVHECLSFFPAYAASFLAVDQQFARFVAGLVATYRNQFVFRIPAATPPHLAHAVYALHHCVYLPQTARPRAAIGTETARAFVLSLDPKYVWSMVNHGARASATGAQ